MPGKMLYSPKDLNRAFAEGFESGKWQKERVKCDYPTDCYRPGYSPKPMLPICIQRNRFSKRGTWGRDTVQEITRLWFTTSVQK